MNDIVSQLNIKGLLLQKSSADGPSALYLCTPPINGVLSYSLSSVVFFFLYSDISVTVHHIYK